MKQCPRCNQTYTDEQLNFCLSDGELLTRMPSSGLPFDDSPPTIVMDNPRVTSPTNWQPPSAPPTVWQNQQPQQQFGQYAVPVSPNQTLAVVSLCLGIGSLTIGWCCSLGLVLSPAALITGFIALSQIKKDPQRNGGRVLAIGGIATAAVFIAVYAVIILLYGFAILFGGLTR